MHLLLKGFEAFRSQVLIRLFHDQLLEKCKNHGIWSWIGEVQYVVQADYGGSSTHDASLVLHLSVHTVINNKNASQLIAVGEGHDVGALQVFRGEHL